MSGTDAVIVGRISGVFGVRGWVKVYSYTQPKDNIIRYRPWLLNGTAHSLEAGQIHGKGIIAKLHGCDTPAAAAALIGCDIGVQREQLPTLAADEYYWADLIGLRVFNHKGQDLGQVESLLETGAHDVLVLSHGVMVPFVPERFVIAIDLAQGIMQVDWDIDWDTDA
jgi:16S rRNA processing protein RimM